MQHNSLIVKLLLIVFWFSIVGYADGITLKGQLTQDVFPLKTTHSGSTEYFIGWKEPLKIYYTLIGTACGTSSIQLYNLQLNDKYDLINPELWEELSHKIGTPISSTIPATAQNTGRNKLSFVSQIKGKIDCHLKVNIDYPETNFNKIASPQAYGFKNNLNDLDEKIQRDIRNGFPGAIIMVIKDGHVVFNKAYGCLSILDKEGRPISRSKCIKVNSNTAYDLASLTKVFGVTLPMMHEAFLNELNFSGININKKLHAYVPRYSPGFNNTTIWQLLNHSAGNPPDIELFDNGYYDPRSRMGWLAACGLGYYSVQRNVSKQIEYQYPSKQTQTRGKNIYSDVDFIILGFSLEDILKEPLPSIIDRLYAPLFKDTPQRYIGYMPISPHGFDKTNIASTTFGDTLVCGGIKQSPAHPYYGRRTKLMTGVVNDPTAYHSLGQVSGHAGLFANIKALGVLSQLVLNGGGYGTVKLFDNNIINEFITPSYITGDPSFAQGWRSAAAPVGTGDSYLFGGISSPEVFGHDGWTGTFVVIDRTNNMVILGLTNKRNTAWNEINRYNDIDSRGHFVDKYTLPVYGNIINIIYSDLGQGFPGHFYPNKFEKYLHSNHLRAVYGVDR